MIGEFLAGLWLPSAAQTRGARHERACSYERARNRSAWACSGLGPLCALWAAPGGDPGRDRCVRAEARVMVCGTPHAAAMATRAAPRRAIARAMPACRQAQGADGRDAGFRVSCRVLLTLW